MTIAFFHQNFIRLIQTGPLPARLATANNAWEIAARTVWVAQYEKQIADEIAFLTKRGIIEPTLDDIDDDELLAALLD